MANHFQFDSGPGFDQGAFAGSEQEVVAELEAQVRATFGEQAEAVITAALDVGPGFDVGAFADARG